MLRRALRLVLAYLGAVAAATIVTVALIMLWVAASAPGNVIAMLKTVPMMLLQGAAITAVTAFPGWVLAVALGETYREQLLRFYMAAGVATAFFAHGLLAYSTGSRNDMFLTPDMLPIVLASLVGGLIGGLAHWRIAIRSAEARAS
jgi:hypothetical protein